MNPDNKFRPSWKTVTELLDEFYTLFYKDGINKWFYMKLQKLTIFDGARYELIKIIIIIYVRIQNI